MNPLCKNQAVFYQKTGSPAMHSYGIITLSITVPIVILSDCEESFRHSLQLAE